MTVVQMKDVIPAMTDLPAAGAAAQPKGNGFSQTFDSASRNLSEGSPSDKTGPDKINRNQVDSNAAKDAGNAMKKARRAESRKEDVGDKVNAENLQQLEETAEVMVQKVAEVTDTTPEEVTEALDALGLSEDALFTTEGLGMVLTELKDVEDPILIVTDPELGAQFSELTEAAEDLITGLQSDLGLDETEMAELMKAFGEERTEVTPMAETEAEPVIADEELPVVTAKENVKETENEPKEEVEAGFTVNETVKTEETEGAEKKGTEKHESKSGTETGKHTDNTISQPVFLKETGEVVFQTEATVEAELPRMSAQEIYDQIGDYLKTISGDNMDSVEMQLHPESLGTLQIRVTSRGGNVTASLVAQNEAVRAALETQIVTLKQSFEEQGIKVDAVEVTVASHQFESAMEQGNQSAAGNGQNEAKKPSTRSLNLNEDFDEEELTEEEQIAVEMMEANGNTVDYKA